MTCTRNSLEYVCRFPPSLAPLGLSQSLALASSIGKRTGSNAHALGPFRNIFLELCCARTLTLCMVPLKRRNGNYQGAGRSQCRGWTPFG